MKRVSTLSKTAAMIAASLMLLGACGDDNTADSASNSAAPAAPSTPAADASSTTGSGSSTSGSGSASSEAKLTDPQIASIAVTANQIDIDYAKIAEAKATNPEVKQFADTMAKDHQAVIDQATALATKLGVTPEDNPTTQSLLDGAEKIKAEFSSLSGAAFDKAYIDNEVAYHKAAISVVETKLVADATSPELKALLESALPLFKSHLAHAEMVQSAVAK